MLKAVKTALSLPNPTYHLMLKRNPNSRFYLSPTIPYYRYEKVRDILHLPRGVVQRVRLHLQNHAVHFESRDRRVRVPLPDGALAYGQEDRPYQEGIVDALASNEGGIARLGTGFGKTHLALRLVQRLGQRTLVLAPRRDILDQFERHLGIPSGEASGLESRGIYLRTFAKAQRESQEFLDSFGCLIVDECHQAVAKGTWKLIGRIPAAYRFGFTGTLERTDGQSEALKWAFGEVLVDRDLPQELPKVQVIPYDGRIGYGEYHEIAENLSKDEGRNSLILDTVQELHAQGRNVLVLVKRVEHAQELARRLGPKGHLALASDGVVERSERAHKYGQAGLHPVLVGTYSLLSTGVDHPSLDTVVFAGDLKADTLARQSVGRVLRLFESKSMPLVCDIQDRGNGILKAQARHRNNLYERLGWEMIS